MEKGDKKEHYKSKMVFKIVLVVALIIVIAFLGYSLYYGTCGNDECFNNALENCKRVEYISYGNMSFAYKIEGKDQDYCSIRVKLLGGEFSDEDSRKLVGKDMVCLIPFGAIIAPESNIDNCHGLLKEGLQEIIISKLHRYISQNIGRLGVGGE